MSDVNCSFIDLQFKRFTPSLARIPLIYILLEKYDTEQTDHPFYSFIAVSRFQTRGMIKLEFLVTLTDPVVPTERMSKVETSQATIVALEKKIAEIKRQVSTAGAVI